MHELAIAQEIIDVVKGEIEKRSIERIDEVGIQLGSLSGIDPEALAFSFKAATMDTILAGVKLNIKLLPVEGVCRACGLRIKIQNYEFLCPVCNATNIEITQGEELNVEYVIEHEQ